MLISPLPRAAPKPITLTLNLTVTFRAFSDDAQTHTLNHTQYLNKNKVIIPPNLIYSCTIENTNTLCKVSTVPALLRITSKSLL